MFLPVITIPLPVITIVIFQDQNWRQLCRIQLHAKWIFWYLYYKMGSNFHLNSNICHLPLFGSRHFDHAHRYCRAWELSWKSFWIAFWCLEYLQDLQNETFLEKPLVFSTWWDCMLAVSWMWFGGGGTLLRYKIYLTDHSFDCLKKFICCKYNNVKVECLV